MSGCFFFRNTVYTYNIKQSPLTTIITLQITLSTNNLLHTAILAEVYFSFLSITYNADNTCNFASQSIHQASCTLHIVLVARCHDSLFEIAWNDLRRSSCCQALTVRLHGDPQNCVKRRFASRFESCYHHVVHSSWLGGGGQLPSLCMRGTSVRETHHKFVHFFRQYHTSNSI